jgi:hypothetical protein
LANYDSMFKRIHEVKLLWQKWYRKPLCFSKKKAMKWLFLNL